MSKILLSQYLRKSLSRTKVLLPQVYEGFFLHMIFQRILKIKKLTKDPSNMESWRAHLEHIPSNYGIAYSFNEFILSDDVFFDKKNQLFQVQNTTLPYQTKRKQCLPIKSLTKRFIYVQSFQHIRISIKSSFKLAGWKGNL